MSHVSRLAEVRSKFLESLLRSSVLRMALQKRYVFTHHGVRVTDAVGMQLALSSRRAHVRIDPDSLFVHVLRLVGESPASDELLGSDGPHVNVVPFRPATTSYRSLQRRMRDCVDRELQVVRVELDKELQELEIRYADVIRRLESGGAGPLLQAYRVAMQGADGGLLVPVQVAKEAQATRVQKDRTLQEADRRVLEAACATPQMKATYCREGPEVVPPVCRVQYAAQSPCPVRVQVGGRTRRRSRPHSTRSKRV